MSWASHRVTTRVEDMAYCLLGIFDVSMPMLYGEGDRAFLRLQEEIIKDLDDQSVFAWSARDVDPGIETVGCFATHPSQFRECCQVESIAGQAGVFSLTNKGLRISLPLLDDGEDPRQKIAVLACARANDASFVMGIALRVDPSDSTKLSRRRAAPVPVPVRDKANLVPYMREFFMNKKKLEARGDNRPIRYYLQGPRGSLTGFGLVHAVPPDAWTLSETTETMTVLVPGSACHAGGGFSAAALLNLVDTGTTFCLVLGVEEGVETMGLVEGPGEVSLGDDLDAVLGELRDSAPLVVDPDSAEVELGTEWVLVEMKPMAAGSRVVDVVIGRVRGYPTPSWA